MRHRLSRRWAKVFNPALPIFRVNAVHNSAVFPDAAVPLYRPLNASLTKLVVALEAGEGHAQSVFENARLDT